MVKSFPDWLVEKAVTFVIKHMKNLDPELQRKFQEALKEEAQTFDFYSQNQAYDWNYNALVNKLQGSLPKIQNYITEQSSFHYVPGVYPAAQTPCRPQTYYPQQISYYPMPNQYPMPRCQNPVHYGVSPPGTPTKQPFITSYVMEPTFENSEPVSSHGVSGTETNTVQTQNVGAVPIPIVDLNTGAVKVQNYSSSHYQYDDEFHHRRNSIDDSAAWKYNGMPRNEKYWRLDDKDDDGRSEDDRGHHKHRSHRVSETAMNENDLLDSKYKTKRSCLKKDRGFSANAVNYPGLPIGAYRPSNFD